MNELAIRLAVLSVIVMVGFTDFTDRTCQSGCDGDRCLNMGGGRRVTLLVGRSLTSNNGRVVAKMQYDGNFVVYCTNTYPWKAVWATNTDDDNIVKGIVFQGDGNLVLYGNRRRVAFAANSHDKGGAKLVMQDDANLVIYTNYGKAVWATNTDGDCD